MPDRSPGESAPSLPQTLIDRRPARRFEVDRTLDDSTLRFVLDAATRAPSPHNLQPWRFLVVREAKNRRRLRDCAHGLPWLTEASAVVLVLGYLNPELVRLDRVLDEQLALGILDEQTAPAARFRAVRSLSQLDEAGRALWATRAAMLAASCLINAALEVGLAANVSDDFDVDRLRAAFGIPDDHIPCTLIALGYATDRSPTGVRIGLDEICDLEHFGAPWPQPFGTLDSPGKPH